MQAPQTPSPGRAPAAQILANLRRRALGPGCPRADRDHHPLSPRYKPRHHFAARLCAAAAAVHPPPARPPRPPAPPWVLARGVRAREHPPADYPPREHPAQRLPRGRRPRASPRATAAERTAAASTPRNGCREDGGREHPLAHSTNLLGPTTTNLLGLCPCTPPPSTPPTLLGPCPRTPLPRTISHPCSDPAHPKSTTPPSTPPTPLGSCPRTSLPRTIHHCPEAADFLPYPIAQRRDRSFAEQVSL
jgi:hypothetical protein